VNYLEALQAKAFLGTTLAAGSIQGDGLRGQSFAGFTGTMAAALAAGSVVFAARYPAAATGKLFVSWLHLHFTTLVAFTTPITAGRRLTLRRGAGGNPSTGTAIDVVRDVSDMATEQLLTGQVATTTGLTMTGVTLETATRARLMLSQVGAAGADYDEMWRFDGFSLLPGELFAILAPAAFDAAGTWQLSVKGEAFEVQYP
jgi:hypothetical protein